MARTSHIDFDKIPSPRPNTSLQRSARKGVPGPSSASKSSRVFEPEPDSDSPNLDPGDQDTGMDIDIFDDYAQQQSQSPDQISPRRRSFGRMEQEEDEDEDEEEEQPPLRTSPKKAKGKQKATLYQEPDQDAVEDEGLGNAGLGLLDSDDSDEDVEPPVKKAKARDRPKTQSNTKKENREPRAGVRRSQREHYKPLEYWRGEKLVYGRTHHSGPILVPQIKEIIRIPKEVPVPLRAKRKRGASTRARSQSKTLTAVEDPIPPALPVVDPEAGWDDDTEAKCTVIHFTTREEVDRR